MWPTLFSNVHGDVLGNATARLGPAPGTRVPLLTFPQRRVASILVPGVPGGKAGYFLWFWGENAGSEVSQVADVVLQRV